MINYTDIELSYVVPVYIQNEKCTALQDLIQNYESYQPALLKKIHFIFVDDCSPVKIEINSRMLNYTLARIVDDIPWNQGGARNLGAMLAKSPKLILTDLDHSFPESLLQHLLQSKIPNVFYRIRREQEGKKISSGANIFYCSKSLFYKSLGVDEEFCGHYGYEDVYFAELQKALGSKFRKIRKFRLILHEHKTAHNPNQHFLKRDTARNLQLLDEKRKHLRTNNPMKGHSRLSINFKWEIINTNSSTF